MLSRPEIRKVINYSQVLGQSAGYLRSLGVKTESVHDTSGNAKIFITSGEHTSAAIASRKAVEIYGMQILQEVIEDNQDAIHGKVPQILERLDYIKT